MSGRDSPLPSTELVAWYGAVVATLTFIFGVWRYSRERARLRVRIVPTYYHDGGYSNVEKTAHGTQMEMIPYFHVEVTNVGERSATILGVAATTAKAGLLEHLFPPKASFRGVIGNSGAAFLPHYGMQLPHVLPPGSVWSCRVTQTTIYGLLQGGKPKLELTASCWNAPRLVRFPQPSIEHSSEKPAAKQSVPD